MKAPDGTPIVATLETIPGEAPLAWGEGFDFEFRGGTEVYWDDQKTVRRAGQDVYLDEEGNEWLESQLVDDDAEPVDIFKIEPWHRNRELRRIEIVNTVETLMWTITGKPLKVADCQYLQRAVTLLLNRSENTE